MHGYTLCVRAVYVFFFFFNDTATTEIYTLSLHDALPNSASRPATRVRQRLISAWPLAVALRRRMRPRSEEHTSELQSPEHLVCRLLIEKKKKKKYHLHKLKKKKKIIY